MKIGAASFLLTESSILLGLKKRGFGSGKWNGFGGKILPDEQPELAAVREIQEESELVVAPSDLEVMGEVNFYFAGVYVFQVFVFLVRKWPGQEKETEEMRPERLSLSAIPYEQMWVSDSKWLPLVLSGKKIKARTDFDESGEVLEKFSYEELV